MRESEGLNQGSNISPSNTGKTERRSLFATKFPHEVVKRTMHVVRKHPLAVGEALLAIGGGAYGVTEGISLLNGENSSPPPATRDIGSVPGTSFSPEQQLEGLPPHLELPKPPQSVSEPEKKVNPEEVFDNGAKIQKISKNNAHFISLEQARELNLEQVVINKEERTIGHILPFMVPKNTTGEIERVDLMAQNPAALVNPKLLPTIEPIDLKFDKIVSIFVPERAHVYLIRGNPEFGEDPNFAARLRIYKYYKDYDTTILWNFSDGGVTPKRYPFNPLLPMQDFNKEVGRGTNYEELPIVDALTLAMTSTEPNQPIRLVVQAFKGKVVGPEAEIADQDFLLKAMFKINEERNIIIVESEN